jgi:hypothetical protein
MDIGATGNGWKGRPDTMDTSLEIQFVRDVLLAGYEVSMFAILFARPLENGGFACEVDHPTAPHPAVEMLVHTAEAAATWLVTTRHQRKLGREYETTDG